ncbi:MAG TPA: DUF3892 domain-containing protein [Noviherbaspirillum sp.]|nr:DUF3892 domain-containing protein [Noviherbaspirillum sp.]
MNLDSASGITRTYSAFPGAEYTSEHAEALTVKTYDFGDFDSDFVYLSIRATTGTNQFDVYLKIKKEIDIAAEFAKIITYVDAPVNEEGEPTETYDILEIFSVVAILGESVAFNTEHPEENITSEVMQEAIDGFNATFTAFITGLRDGASPDVVDFLRAQLNDPLTLPLLETIAFKAFPETTLGVYLNLHLLAHASGFVGSRGDTNDAENFLPSEDAFAIGTSSSFTRHLLDDILIKKILQFRVDNGELADDELASALSGSHFPMTVSLDMFEASDEEDDTNAASDKDGDGAVHFEITDTDVATESYTFEDAEGNKTSADSLKVVIKTNADLWKFINLADENIVLYLTPVDRSTEGFSVADIGIDTNLRMDVGRTLLDAFLTTVVASAVPLYGLKLLLVPIVAIINLVVNSREEFAGFTASESGIEALARLSLASKRWDPFYTTSHDLLFQKSQFVVEDNRIFLSGTPALSKSYTPYPTVYPRDVSYTGTLPHTILYKVEGTSAIQSGNQFATDRETFTEETSDAENRIYSLVRSGTDGGSATERIAAKKLEPYIPFAPYCITRDGSDHDRRIDAIGMLSDEEVRDIENRLENAWLDAKTTEIMDALVAMGLTFTEEEYDQVYAFQYALIEDNHAYSAQLAVIAALPGGSDIGTTLKNAWLDATAAAIMAAFIEMGFTFTDEDYDKVYALEYSFVEDSHAYSDYLAEQLDSDVEEEIFIDGTLRLKLSPQNVDQLVDDQIIELPGYTSVSRKGRVYIRNIADRSETNNLLNLRSCSS